jgi:ABC-type multidrug transport system ATPase subunit
MDEAALCDRVALMQSGTIMRIDKPEAIVLSFPKKLLAVRSADMFQLMQDLREFDASLSINLFGSKVHIAVDPGLSVQKEIQTWLLEKGHTDVSVEETAAGIEDCFIELMNKTGAHGNSN